MIVMEESCSFWEANAAEGEEHVSRWNKVIYVNIRLDINIQRNNFVIILGNCKFINENYCALGLKERQKEILIYYSILLNIQKILKIFQDFLKSKFLF